MSDYRVTPWPTFCQCRCKKKKKEKRKKRKKKKERKRKEKRQKKFWNNVKLVQHSSAIFDLLFDKELLLKIPILNNKWKLVFQLQRKTLRGPSNLSEAVVYKRIFCSGDSGKIALCAVILHTFSKIPLHFHYHLSHTKKLPPVTNILHFLILCNMMSQRCYFA